MDVQHLLVESTSASTLAFAGSSGIVANNGRKAPVSAVLDLYTENSTHDMSRSPGSSWCKKIIKHNNRISFFLVRSFAAANAGNVCCGVLNIVPHSRVPEANDSADIRIYYRLKNICRNDERKIVMTAACKN